MFRAINRAQLRTSPFMALLVSVCLAMSVGFPACVIAASNATSAKLTGAQSAAEQTGRASAGNSIAAVDAGFSSVQKAASKSAGKKTTYIVVLKDVSLARYSGGVAGYPATSAQAKGAPKLNARAPESVRYLSYLADQRAAAITSAASVIGRQLDVSYEYGATIVGFAADMTAKEAQRIAALDQVAFVEIEKISVLHTDAGPAWSGATGVWGSNGTALSYATELAGSNEVPPVTSDASGTGDFAYNFTTNALTYTITVANPGNLQLTAMHIHHAGEGSTGPAIHDLNLAATTSGFVETGSVTLSGIEEAALVNGQLYVNVHSSTHSEGEIRGQITLSGTLGEGIIVGIIDTGIDPWNPSFLGTGGDGYVHSNPLGAGSYLGVCDALDPAYDSTFTCNEKLIGAWSYPSVNGGNARDVDGHGSHTASTVAGNFVFDAQVVAPTKTFSADISGMAPHANIIAYNACCTGAALAAAREQALLDGVDVINYSIGAATPTGDFWQDSESIQWLALREAGVFVATSNGNAGNSAGTTGSPADLPWLTSVGASSHDRAFLVTLELTDSNNTSITVSGQAGTTGYGPAEVVFSDSTINTESARLCAPGAFPEGTFDGEIVVCERGTYGRVDKGQAVLDGGAGGLILAQATEDGGGPGAVATDLHVLPAVHIDYYEYQKLRQFMLVDAVGTVNGDLSDAVLDKDDAHGDIMGSFSSRGPNGTDADLIVPSVTAPGRAILAAYHQDTNGDYTYNILQGTSMASPHVAGAGALLSALHPDWTPAEMQSALMMTAFNGVLDDDAINVATPFAQGSGHIFVSRAAASPLVMNVTRAEYDAADPDVANGFDVRDLNIASLGDDACLGSCSWTRSVRNVSDETLTWQASFAGSASFTVIISPAVFTLDPGESQEIGIELSMNPATAFAGWYFGTVYFDESSDSYPDAHWPLAVVPTSSNIPETLDIVTQTTSGSVAMNDLVAVDISDLQVNVIGLAKASRHNFTLIQDNNLTVDFPDLFFDTGSPTQFVAINVPQDSFSVIAEIVETASPDLDILLFLDVNGNGPGLDDVGDLLTNPNACLSAAVGSDEFCEILSPAAGTYYAAILNYTQATVGGDPVDLATAVIPNNGADAGNLTVTGPTTVAGGAPFAINVSYNDATMNAIDKLYGYFSMGTDSANPDNLAKVRVSLEYSGIPDIAINPTALSATINQETTLSETLTLTATGGVLDWTVLSSDGNQAVQGGSFEEGYPANPYWQADASQLGSILPICSAATCGYDFATHGDWFLWMGGASNLTAYAQQEVTISSGDVATLSFNMHMQTNRPFTTAATLSISIDGTQIMLFTKADLNDYDAGFAPVNIDVSTYADGGNHTLRFDFENASSDTFNVFIDEVSLVSVTTAGMCHGVGSISWLDVSPSSGSLSPGQTDLTVTYNAAGLALGVYTDNLCVSSNDPDEPVLRVPVMLTVEIGPTIFSDGFEQ